ncbi:MAG: nucleoside-diphosphate kinase [Candidatus Pacebacteria bacterium]|nr:nucleoside-diphosphate kinase [Candidatus Paceibacterota bacterium]
MDSETFGLIKPDGFKRKLTTRIIYFVLKNGFFTITEIRWIILTQKEAEKLCLYNLNHLEIIGDKVVKTCREAGIDPRIHWGSDYDLIRFGRMVRQWNIRYLTEGPLCFLSIRGTNGNTPQEFKNFVGKTDENNINTVRGRFKDPEEDIKKATERSMSFRNVIHVPDPDRIAFERAIILGAKTLHIIKPG